MFKVSKMQYSVLYTTALSVLLLLVASEIRIPIGVVPITLQTFVLYLLGLQLDKYSAIITGITFIVIKMLTLPVPIYPTFGYIVGIGIAIPAMVYIRQASGSKLITCAFGYVVTTACGVLWLHHFVQNWHAVWLQGVAPFVLGDTLKVFGAICTSAHLTRCR